jgi:hypothetical protein
MGARGLMFIKTQPLIVIGASSSGTSLVSRIMSSAGLFMGRKRDENAESIFFQELNISIFRSFNSSWHNTDFYPEFVSSLACSDQLAQEIKNRLNHRFYHIHFGFLHAFSCYRKEQKSPTCWGWKDPRNTITLPLWVNIFPGAKVLHVIRNGLDVAISIHEREERRNAFAEERGPSSLKELPIELMEDTSLENCFKLWENYVRIGCSYRDKLNSRYMEVRFEDLLSCPERVLNDVMKFCDFDDEERRINIERSLSLIDSRRTRRYKKVQYSEFYETTHKHPLMQALGY